MKKRLLTLGLCSAAILSGCGFGNVKINPNKEKYVVGIAQFVEHKALDLATQGFKERLTELLTTEGRQVEFEETNSLGDPTLTPTVVSTLVAKDVDLIMANATPCVSAAYSATYTIPILGTSVTDYGVAIEKELKNNTTGVNLSGTSDLAPLDQQVNEMVSLLGEGRTKYGILYCSNEANSKFQADEVKRLLEAKGKQVTIYTFAQETEIVSTCGTIAAQMEAVFVPTDNTCDKYSETLGTALAGIPVYSGESGICEGCGFATLSIDYLTLGKITGEMAFNVLLGKKDIRNYEIQYDRNPVKKYIASRCTALGIVVPSDYVAIPEE